MFDDIKKDAGKLYPRFCVHYIINKENIHEADKMIDVISDLGVDTWFIQYTKILHAYPEIKDLHVNVPNDVVNKIRIKAKKKGVDVRFNVNTGNTLCPSYSCSAWTQPFIFSSGEMIPCCACNEANNRPMQRKTSMGNLFENTLEEIWHGKKYKELRRNIFTGQTTNCCEPCPIFNQRNSP